MPKTQLISSPTQRFIVPLCFIISSLSDVKYRLRIYTKSNAGMLSDNGVKPLRSTNKTARLRITPSPSCFNRLFSAFLSFGGLISRFITTVPPLLKRVAHPSRILSPHFRVPRNLRDLPASDHHKKCLLVSSQQIISAQQYNIVGKLICIGYCLGNSQGVS